MIVIIIVILLILSVLTFSLPSLLGSSVSLNKKIKVFSWNVCWESMAGKPGWKLCNQNTSKQICINNAKAVIKNVQPCDFIALQEYSDSLFSSVSGMSTLVSQSGHEKMLTAWNKKYTLRQSYKDEFSVGRPFQILIFDDIIFINVHPGHQQEFIRKINKIKNYLQNINLSKYKIIMAGDFNMKMPLSILNMHTQSIQNTCCYPNYFQQYDYIFSSTQPSLSTVSAPKLSSDHKPVVATI